MTLCPDARLDLPAASRLRQALQDCPDHEVIVDMAQVTHLGALCVQVLISAARSLQSQGRNLSMLNTTDRVLDQLRLMGFTPESIAKGGV
jgi:chemotaxis protein CheX